MATVTELVYTERDTGPLLMDLYLPPTPQAPVPAVIWLHGGGWAFGDRTLAPDLSRYFAVDGIAMASIAYRLSGQAIFPAQLHDVRAAVRYLRSHAGELGLDPGAIGLWGSSAGGHLAALAGVTGHLPELPGEPGAGTDVRVQAVADGYGPVDLAQVVAEAGHGLPELSGENSPEARLLGGLPDQQPELARQASPLTYVTSEAPPFQIAHGTADVTVRSNQSVLLHEALAAAGVESSLYLIDRFGHGFLNPPAKGDFSGPAFSQAGRLAAEPHAPAKRHYAPADGAPVTVEDATFSFAVIGRFFSDHLLRTGATA